MTVNLSALAGAGQQFFTDAGVPLSGGKLYSYAAGTTTPQATYTSSSGSTAHTNPIILDSAGRVPGGEIWLTAGSSYKFVLKTSTDTTIATWDNITGINGTGIATNAANVQYDPAGAGAVSTTVQAKLRQTVNVKDYGATGDGSTDDSASILAALNACGSYGTVFFAAGTYVVGSQINIPQNNITIDGQGATLIAKASTNFEYMLLGTSLTNVVVKNLNIDANQTNRVTGQNVRFMGAGFTSCTDSRFINCIVRNVLGYTLISGVGLTLGGVCTRCQIINCTAIDCGTLAKPADAYYTSGESNMIIGSEAVNVFDTGFVIESSNNSGIIGCIARNCSGAAAITNAVNADKYGNFINGLTALDTSGGTGVTGQMSFGCPLSTSTGDLYDTLLSNIVMVNNAAGTGNGPAINIRKTGTAKTKRMTLSNVRIRNSIAQGILVDGDEVMIHACDISNVTFNAIQVETGSLNCSVIGCTIVDGERGIVTTGTAEIIAQSNFIKSFTGHGMFAFDTSTINAYMNTVETAVGVARYGKAAGATLNIVSATNTFLCINNADGSAPVGAIVDKFPIVDANGNGLGYVPLYNS
jgi:hypothetical protein